MARVAIVLAGGDLVAPDMRHSLPRDAYVVAADSGLHLADILDLHVDRAAGDLVTLLPAGGCARGITTKGLQYPLHGEDLLPGTTRGVSNVIVDHPVSVVLDEGTLLVVQPLDGAS